MATLNLGRVQPIDRGVYNPAYAYKKLDFVTSTDGLNYYTCILDAPAGTPLTDVTYFRKAITSPATMSGSSYDNSTSGLTATNGQDAIDEVVVDYQAGDVSASKIATDLSGKVLATGSAVFTNADNNINLPNIGVGVEVGDVIQVSGSNNNDTELTIEFVTDADNVIVNQAHAGKSRTVSPIGTKALVDETATVTVELLCKWYLAPAGLGQGWVDVLAERVSGVTYSAPANRSIEVSITIPVGASSGRYIVVDGFSIAGMYTSTDPGQLPAAISAPVNAGLEYSIIGALEEWSEQR